MRLTRAKHLQAVEEHDETHAVVKTEEDERIEFDGCSEAEVDAKLHDFYAWAS